jgi:asparagine synthase (glutamine-hydrolysing)
MCGIYGQIGRVEIHETRAQLATDHLAHRGPDERGTWIAGTVFLGMRRLSIIDLSGGQQPIWNVGSEPQLRAGEVLR